MAASSIWLNEQLVQGPFDIIVNYLLKHSACIDENVKPVTGRAPTHPSPILANLETVWRCWSLAGGKANPGHGGWVCRAALQR